MESHETDELLLPSRVLNLARRCDELTPLEDYSGYYKATGPCGDTVEIWIKLENGVVSGASCRVKGCIPSKACAASAVFLAVGKDLKSAKAISARDILDYVSDLPEEAEHCALLAADTLELALKSCVVENERG